jgi:hypothetical protein
MSNPELSRTFADPVWRMNNLYKIVTKKREWVTLKQNRVQRTLTENRHVKRKKILKARQEGVSTNEIISQFDFTIFHRNVTACILADSDDSVRKLFRIVQRAYSGLHPSIRPDLGRGGGSMYEYYFPSLNSRIYCALKSRGDTINWLHISESAFIDKTDRIDATVETVPIDGIITHETTANGMNNHFYDFWQEDNGYEKFFFPWYFHDEYRLTVEEPIELTDEELDLVASVKRRYGIDLDQEQIAFRRWKKKGRLFAQEYAEDEESCFMSTGKRVIDPEIVRNLEQKVIEPIIKKDEWFKQYHPYDNTKHYVIGADVAEGFGGDYSVAVVLQTRPLREVAIIRSNRWKPREFAEKLQWLAGLFRGGGKMWPVIAPELNNHGHSVVQKLEDLVYPNIFQYNKDKRGWLTNTVTRPKMLDALIDAVESEMIEFNSPEFFKECLTLVDNDGKPEAATGKNDDVIMAAAIALQMAIDMDDIANYVNLKEKIRV